MKNSIKLILQSCVIVKQSISVIFIILFTFFGNQTFSQAVPFYISGPATLCDPNGTTGIYRILPQPGIGQTATWTFTDYYTSPATVTILTGLNINPQTYTWGLLNGVAVGGTIEVTYEECPNEPFLEVVACCVDPSSFNTIVEDGELISNLGLNSLNGNTIFVKKEFIIDKSCSINNAHFYMEQGAHIIVSKNGNGANVDLDLTDCTFEACNYMWRGITLQEDVKVSSYGKCVFKDATWAINSHAGSDFYLNKCDFTNNIFGISALIENPFPEGNFTITDCNFNFSGALKASYPTQIPIGTHPTAGIYMENRHGIIGSNKYSANTFFDLNTGIQLINSTIQIYNANFEAIHTDGTFTDEYMGSAIYTNDEIGVSLNTFNPLLVDGTHFIGGISYPLVTFKDCDFGVYAKNAQTIIYNCKMENMITGFLAKGLTNLKKAYIGNSYIEANGVGIDYLLNPGAFSLVANKNTIYSTHSKARCIVAEDIVIGNTALEIYENTLFNMGKEAIDVKFFKLPVVKDNTIQAYGALNPDFCGISINNCNKANVACNYVLGGGKNAANINNNGISFTETTESFMDCNTVDNTTKGIGFYGGCSSTKMRGNTILNHNLGLFVHSTGVIGLQNLNGNRWLGNITTPDYGASNDNIGAAGIGPEKINVNTNGGLNPEFTTTVNPNTSSLWFNIIPGTNFQCTADICDPKKNQSNSNSNLLVEQSIADGTYTTEEFTDESQDLAKQYLFNKLQNDSILLYQDSSFQAFFTAQLSTTINTIQQVKTQVESLNEYDVYFTTVIKTADSLLGQLNDSLLLLDSLRQLSILNDSILDFSYASLRAQISNVQNTVQQAIQMHRLQQTGVASSAQSINSSINSSKLVEQNEKVIASIYLETVAIGLYYLNSNQAALVLAIAQQCPYSGGPAVYKARILNQLVAPNTEYNDFATCLSQGYLRKAITRKIVKELYSDENAKFAVVPNPAINEVTFYYQNFNSNNSILEIIDIAGNLIEKIQLPLDANSLVYNTEQLINGVYFIKFSSVNQAAIINKLIIAK